MRRTGTSTTTAAALVLLLTLTGCQDTTAPTSPQPPANTPATSPSPGGADKPRTTGVLPDLVGKGLQYAQDEAQAAGFLLLTSHDALGRGREQVLDRNWKVCTQNPAPGTHATTVKVDFGTVKLTEECPAKDAGTPDPADGTMPDLVGRSVKVARQVLPSNSSIDVRDASGKGRAVLVESNWRVCRTTPAAGATLDGSPIRIDTVKFDESC
ncbi:hypothetical protein [Streptomyces sp. NPDC047928]|uniref:hypothetical protein n=1 Tax=unclassified Streptomyces TaxID=2593676 RepID=UPI00372335B8